MSNEIKLSNAAIMLNSAHKSSSKAVSNEEKAAPAQHQVPSGDKVSVTADASRLQKIEEQLNAMPEINHEKVAEIKKAIADGTFSLDPARIADKLIAFETSIKH
jgi:negative regulator of flagellin synthesis FlgM